jgi:hypothetical protein
VTEIETSPNCVTAWSPTPRRPPSTCTCTGSTRPRSTRRSRLRKRERCVQRQALQHFDGDQGFVVAGVVQQPRRHVDGVAKAVARHLHHFAARQRHLQAQGAQARRGTPFAAAQTMPSSTSCICIAPARPAGFVEDGHQAVAQGLDDMALVQSVTGPPWR